jgi:hypothetical protein
MKRIFLEVILNIIDLQKIALESRDEVEDPLEEALSESKVGEIIGGGTGLGKSIIDIEVDEEKLQEGLLVIRQVLQKINVPESTIIKRYAPYEEIFPVY